MNMMETGRFLAISGAVLLILGLLLMVGDRIPLGKLPGDFRFGTERVRVYFPLATCIVVSVIITLIVNFFSRK